MSVIIPTYHRTDIIKYAIDSVIGQTYQNFELLIVDDYGKDSVDEYIKNNYGDDERIKCICNNRKKGVSGARNTGILAAKGDYIAFLDSDDIWDKKHLEELLGAMILENIDMGFALWYEGRKDNLEKIGDRKEFQRLLNKALIELKVKETENYYVWNEDFYEYTIITYFYCYHLNTMIIKKPLLLDVGLFNEDLSSSEDCDLLFKLLSKNKFILYKNYHYTYYFGDDGIYSFCDRGNLSTKIIIENKELVDRLTRLGVDKANVRKHSYRLVIESPYIKDSKKCKKVIYQAIHNKYVTLAVINQKFYPKKSLKFLFMSLRFKFDRKIIRMIIKFLFLADKDYIYTESGELDLS